MQYKLALLNLAAYYEKNLSDEQIVIFAEQLHRALSVEELQMACLKYIDDPKNEFFPRPISKLIELIRKPVSTEDFSQNTTSLLIQAERKFGIHWSEGFYQNGELIFQGKDCAYRNWKDAAISFFGEVGLRVVDRYGGWKDFCMNIYESPDGVVRAQVKNLAIALQNSFEKTGTFDALPSYQKQNQGLASMGQVISIAFGKKDEGF